MTTTELIEKLKQFPSDTIVVVSGYEDGYNDIYNVKQISIKLNANKEEYYGAHKAYTGEDAVPAISLLGENKYSKQFPL